MAIINCPECGKEISDSSEKCIHCGYPLKKKKSNGGNVKIIIAAVAVVAVIIAIIAFVKPGKSNNTCKADGCNNKVYSNGYCLEHYGQVRNGEEVTTEEKKDSEDKTATKNVTENSDGIKEDTEEVTSFSKDSTVSTDSCEFTLLGYNIANKIEPSSFKGSYYHYYEAASGNVFIDVKFKIKNKATKDVQQDSVLRTVKVIYDGNYEYRCSCVTVDKDGDFEGFTSLYSISPLETMEYHMLTEVPTEVKNSNGSLVCRVEVDGNIYECKLR